MLTMLLLTLWFNDKLPGLEHVFSYGTGENDLISWPTDAVFYKDRLFLIDGSLTQLLMVNTINGKVSTFGRKGEAPHEFKHWPESLHITADEKICIHEWNRLREHLFDMFGNHLEMNTFGPQRKKLRERRGQVFRRLSYNEAVKQEALWESVHEPGVFLGKIPEKHVFYNLYFNHSLIDVGEDGSVGVMDHGGFFTLYDGNHKIIEFAFPVEHLKGEIRKDKFRSGFLAAVENHPVTDAYLGRAPVLDFAIMNKKRAWALAKNEHLNGEPTGQQEVWLISMDIMTKKAEKTKVSFEPAEIRYDFGCVILISKENASVHVYRVKSENR